MKEQEMDELLEDAYTEAAGQEFREFRDRRLPFSGTRNFRDLGGYRTFDGKLLRKRVLYRSGSLHKLTDRDLTRLSGLGLEWIVDFRAPKEKEMEPDRLPVNMAARLVEIPILDSSTQIYQSSREDLVKQLKNIDPVQSLSATNQELATRFTAEMRKFMDVILSSNGRPVLFHCTAGKDRTGFAAAIILRILGVPHDIVMQDYLLTNEYFYAAHRRKIFLLRLWKGRKVAEVVSGLVRADPAYLSAAFQTIDQNHGSFDNYVRGALGLVTGDVDYLKTMYLE
jgi:protein-tyrosine phosphatase